MSSQEVSRRAQLSPRATLLLATVVGIASSTLAGCLKSAWSSGGSAKSIESVQLNRSESQPDGPRFERLDSERTGIDFESNWTPPEKYEHLIADSQTGGGVALGDYNADDLPDVFLTRPFGGSGLYRNLGGFRFEDVTKQAGLEDENFWGQGACFVDIDNDGTLDLYVCAFDGPNRLYINQGDGSFQERAHDYGLDFNGSSIMMAFSDYDLDGDLDGYLVTNRLQLSRALKVHLEEIDGQPKVSKDLEELIGILSLPDGSYKSIKGGQYDHLYRNNGDETFTDVSQDAGIEGRDVGLSATWWDFNDDGLPDLYVANDFKGPDYLYRNEGDGTFKNVGGEILPHTPWYSMGSDVADINNDGRFDFIGSDMGATSHYMAKVAMGDMAANGWFLTYGKPRQYMRNAVYLNTGVERFMEIAFLTGLANTDWTWSTKFADLDNDGWTDLFVSNGMTREWFNSDIRNRTSPFGGSTSHVGLNMWLNSPVQKENNLAFRNLGDLQFQSVGEQWGLDHQGVSFGAALADLNRDGNLDLVVNNFQEPVSIFRNHSSEKHAVLIRLRGTHSNRNGLGSTVRIETENGPQVRYLTSASGFMAANEPYIHFGLGEAGKIDHLSVDWPSGHRQTFSELDVDRLYTITEPREKPSERMLTSEPTVQFRSASNLTTVRHQEKPYNDFADQPLLPNKLSQLGPGIAWGDVNGDRREDLFVGGAAGEPGSLLLNEGHGQFNTTTTSAFIEASDSEDMASLMFDADSDGDLDLYVVSGSVECDAGDEQLRDRLYLNDGQGHFSRAASKSLPEVRDSGSVVTAADFDRDGDLDLFVGGRVIPKQYPVVPESRLLRNDGGRFTDVTDELAPGLGQTGLVTSAIWSDANHDGWVDLLVTHEWGPIRLYSNHQGTLADETDRAGLAFLTGWWNGIAGRDLDNDGDIDYVVTNFGLNTKYHASNDEPAILYYGDFEDSGVRRLIEAEQGADHLWPVRGKSCSQNAMPFVRDKFPTFSEFASASLAEIYTPQCLSNATRYEARTLQSGVLLNDGDSQFTFLPLPRLAQAAPAFGVVLTEFNGDGFADLMIAQNFYSPQRETGRMDGGVGLLLHGRGDGTFEPVWPDRSGVVIPGDAKALTSTDFTGDGRLDIVASVNDAELVALENEGAGHTRLVRLQGPPGNPTAVGARVTTHFEDESQQTAEVGAGGGYLSQSTADLAFGIPPASSIQRIDVLWPDGRTSSHVPKGSGSIVVIDQP